MKISVNKIQLSIDYDESKKALNLLPVFLLHGFTGMGSDWDFLTGKLPAECFPISVDIIGHGKSDSPAEKKYYSEENLVEQLHKVVQYFKFEQNILLGYSLGGRIALSYALKYPENIRGLILESSSPGISNSEERKTRLKNDRKLAENINKIGIEAFIENWLNQPFFNSLKNLGKQRMHRLYEQRILNNSVGISNILTEFSQGRMLPKWKLLEKLAIPMLLISGELDKKYCEINKRMCEKAGNAQVEIVKNCGHNVHLEKEEEFINLVNSFLKKYF